MAIQLSGSLAITGSLTTSTTIGAQGAINVTNATNPVSFTSTASLYSDGGVRFTKDMYVSGTAYFNNVTVFGTQSIAYISSSQLNIGTNLITVNTDTPTIRFGGLAVYDSGSTGLTGSILWDSENNHWVYTNPSGSTYSGGMLISGPRNTNALGSEVGTTACALMMGQGGDHITSSAIFHYGNATCFYGQSFISSSGNACFSGQVCSNIVSTTDGTNTSTLANNYLRYNGGDFYVDACAVGGNFRIRTSNASALDNTALFICGGNSNIGIGTTTPAYKLDVNGSFSFTTGGNYLQYSSGILYHGNYYQYPSGNDYLLFARTSGGLNFGTNDTQRLSISSTGIASFTCQICTVAAVTADLRYTGTGYITYDTSVSGTSCLIVRQDATERIRFNGAGCISVGTTCTLGRLTIASDANTSGITLLNTTAATLGTETQFITWEGLTNGSALHACPLGRIGVINVNGGTSIGSMVFYTKQYNAGICERMRITSDGLMLIGTTTPPSSLDVKLFINSSTGGFTGYAIGGTPGGAVGAAQSSTLNFYTAAGTLGSETYTERLRITSGGIACFACQVCVGGVLVVNGNTINVNCDTTTATDARINLYTRNSVNGDRASIYTYNLSATTAGCELTYLAFGYCCTNNQGYINMQTKSGGAWCNTMYLRNGLVGIGTDAPGAKLEVNGAIISTGLGIGAAPLTSLYINDGTMRMDGSTPLIYLRGGSTGAKGAITLNHFGYADFSINAGCSGNYILGITKTPGGTDGILLYCSGDVGIGISDPQSYSARLTVAGNIRASLGCAIGVWDSGNVTYVQLSSPGTRALRITNDANTEYLRITSAGRIGIGETAPVSALVVSTPSDTSSIGQSGIVIQGSSTLTAGCVMALAFTAIPGTARARAAVGSVVGSDWGKGNLTFYTRDASDATALSTADERMRITSGGCVIVNGTSASSIMTIYPAAGSADTLTYRTTGNSSAGALYAYSDGNGPSSGILHNVSITSGGGTNRFNGSFSGWTIAFDSRPASDTMTFNYVNTSGTYITRISLAGNGITCFGCAISIGAASTSAEANLFLGARGTIEGGQLVLQKGTSCSCATHLDNYNDSFRVLVGTDTGSTGVNMLIDHKTGNACFYGTVSAFQFRNTGIYAGIYCDVPTVCSGYVQYDMVSTNNANLYQVYVATNPNPGGSSTYIDYYYGKIIIGNGYDGANLKTYMTYCPESILPRSLYGSGGGNVAVCVCLVQGGSEYTCVNTGTNYCVRVKIGGNGNYTAVNLVKLL